MSFDAASPAGVQNARELLLARVQPPSTVLASSDTEQPPAGWEALVHSRGAPQEQPGDTAPIFDSPPLHDDQPPEHDTLRPDKPRGLLRRHALMCVIGLVLFLATGAGYLYWDNASHFEWTDDSFIAARQFAIQPKVPGYITAVPVTDNQHVTSGGVIARIDDRDYRVALDQAEALLAHDRAVLEQAKRNLDRYQSLAETNSIPQQQVDDQTYLVAQSKATVAFDQAKVDAAQLDLSHTSITVAQSGRIVNLTAAVGQYAAAGTTLTMFVPDTTWVTANFKETQLGAMRRGQPVSLSIDAYPHRTIHGHVASVQSGSGPAFSLLPPQNATGNWVKVVQRVPVKITMDDPPSNLALGPGMSVKVTVRVNPNPPLYQQLKGWFDARLGNRS